MYKLINSLTFKGKSNLGRRCIYYIFWELKKSNIHPFDFFNIIILRILPKMDLKKTKYRGRIINYPMFIMYSRAVYLALN